MKNIIAEFDKYLKALNLNFEAIVIGGAALNILDISSRKTRDVDCLDPDIPKEIKIASQEFAKKRDDISKDRDTNPNWPTHVETAFAILSKALGYE